jgi:hypothetical protein
MVHPRESEHRESCVEVWMEVIKGSKMSLHLLVIKINLLLA